MTDVQKKEFLPAPSSEEFIVTTRISDDADGEKPGDEDPGIDVDQLTQIHPIRLQREIMKVMKSSKTYFGI